MADYDVSEAFQRIEEEMIASMSRNLRRHLKQEQSEGMNYSMWQAEQLAALTNFRKNNAKAFQSYFSTINGQIETILKMAHQSGAMDQETRILEAIKKGWKASRLPTTDALQGSFFQINERKLNALIEATVNDMKKAETAMLRMADDEYRKTIYNAEVYYNSGAGTLSQCVDMATHDFLAKGISCIEYKNGARVGIDAYAAMALRTAQTRAYLAGEASMRDEWGVSTVIVSKRGVACPRCLRYVGRVFYDDVWGTAPIPSPQKYPLLSEAMAGGLYHPNCRDIHTTYFEGVNTPPTPMTVAEKQEAVRVYNLEQEQRYNERKIRKYKRLAAGSVDPENQAKYQAKLQAWQKKQRDFIAENGDVLKRRYENEKLRLPGIQEPPKINSRKPLDISENSDIIREGKRIAPTAITDGAIDSIPLVEIEGLTPSENEYVRSQHQELLRYARERNDGNEVAFVFRKGFTERSEFLGSDDRIDFGAALFGKGDGLFVMHNHPRNGSFSANDMMFLLGNDAVASFSIVKNDGSIEVLTKRPSHNKNAAMLKFARYIKKYVKNDASSEYDRAIRKFIENSKEELLWQICP